MLEWIEHHAGLAAWVQAVGSIAAIIAVFAVVVFQKRVEQTARIAVDRERGRRIAMLITLDVVRFGNSLRLALIVRDFKGAASADLSQHVRERASEFHFLGGEVADSIFSLLGNLDGNRGERNAALVRIAQKEMDEEAAWEELEPSMRASVLLAEALVPSLSAIIQGTAVPSVRIDRAEFERYYPKSPRAARTHEPVRKS